jgi:hypothetical protein
VIWYIFAVAVLNMGLGFAAAVHLARRHRRLLAVQGFPPANGASLTSGDSRAARAFAERVATGPPTWQQGIADELDSQSADAAVQTAEPETEGILP